MYGRAREGQRCRESWGESKPVFCRLVVNSNRRAWHGPGRQKLGRVWAGSQLGADLGDVQRGQAHRAHTAAGQQCFGPPANRQSGDIGAAAGTDRVPALAGSAAHPRGADVGLGATGRRPGNPRPHGTRYSAVPGSGRPNCRRQLWAD